MDARSQGIETCFDSSILRRGRFFLGPYVPGETCAEAKYGTPSITRRGEDEWSQILPIPETSPLA